MAKIVCVVDTDAKTFDVSVDDTKIENVSDFSVYIYNNDKLSVNLSTYKKLDNGLIERMTYYSDAEDVGSVLAAVADIQTVPGFYGVSEIQNDIRKYIKK